MGLPERLPVDGRGKEKLSEGEGTWLGAAFVIPYVSATGGGHGRFCRLKQLFLI